MARICKCWLQMFIYGVKIWGEFLQVVENPVECNVQQLVYKVFKLPKNVSLFCSCPFVIFRPSNNFRLGPGNIIDQSVIRMESCKTEQQLHYLEFSGLLGVIETGDQCDVWCYQESNFLETWTFSWLLAFPICCRCFIWAGAFKSYILRYVTLTPFLLHTQSLLVTCLIHVHL